MKKLYSDKNQDYAGSFIEGNLIFLSAMDGSSPDTGKITSYSFEEQMTAALDKVRLALKEAGGATDNLVRTAIFIKNVEDCRIAPQIMQKYYRKHAPALINEPPLNTFITVRHLQEPQCKVAVDAIAVIDKNKPGWELKKYSDGAPYPVPSASAGNLLFMPAVDGKNPVTARAPASFEKQMINCLDKIRYTVEEAGGTMNDVIKVVRIMTNLTDIPTMWRTEIEYCQKHAPLWAAMPPASTFLQPQPMPNQPLIEMEAIAVIPANKTGWDIIPQWEVFRRPLYYGVRQPFAKSITVGNLVFLSAMHGGRAADGRPALNDLEAQTLAALDKIRLAMEEAHSSLNNIGKTTIYLKDMQSYPRVREIMLKYFKEQASRLIDEPPAATIVQPQSLANPYHLIAIEAIGVIA